MNRKPQTLAPFFRQLVRRPLSDLEALLALAMIVIPLYQRIIGRIFFEPLNYVDDTTLIMVGILLLCGICSQWSRSDLQAVSIALIGGLSFVFAFEALFKLSFYFPPRRMSPAELREFVIQVGTALTGLAGFAFGRFRFSAASWALFGIFAAGWAAWLLIGFPQLATGADYYRPVVNAPLTWNMIYALNRILKAALFLLYCSFYLPHRQIMKKSESVHPE